MKNRTPIKRYVPVRKKRPHAEIEIGRTGIIRLTGKSLEVLRRECFDRDGWICQDCRIKVNDNPIDFYSKADMAHIQSRGAGGSDVLNNVKTLCHFCHMKEHNCGGRPLSQCKQES